MFRNVHPLTRRNGSVPSEAVEHGRNAERVALSDKRYVRCRQCGFMCHLDRDARAPVNSRAGDGIENIGTGWGDAWGSSGWGTTGNEVKSGCPSCGSYLYA